MLFPANDKSSTASLAGDMNKRNTDGKEEWDTVQGIAKVWRSMPQFSSANTILLDNEAQKFTMSDHKVFYCCHWKHALIRSQNKQN